jgi:ThiF family/Prokaryotic homologs of the JAB domain
MCKVSLTLTEDQRAALREHLFPGDGLEAVAFLLCGRAAGTDRHRLLVRQVYPIAHERCKRAMNSVTWNAEDIEHLLGFAEVESLSLVKVYSHPGGYPRFSEVDDRSDDELLPTIRSWVEADVPHGSVIMLPDGRMFERYLWRSMPLRDFELVNVVGPTLQFWWTNNDESSDAALFGEAQDQAFGEGTTRQMRKLRIAVVGASGTGGPTIEQLMRLGVGHIVPVDDDKIEQRNLNRIPFATACHANAGTPKVLAAAEDIERKGLGTTVTPVVATIQCPEGIRLVSQCDVIFGCVDSIGGRFTMNLLASHYILPLFDLGVLLDAELQGAHRGTIKDILGTIHYIVPGRSSLLTRDQFTLADVAAEGLHKKDPAAAAQQVEDKYIKGLGVRRPAVISVNMFASALAVNDFLARIYPYRKIPNESVASIEFSLNEIRLTTDEEVEPCAIMGRYVGFGDRRPLLGLPEYGE